MGKTITTYLIDGTPQGPPHGICQQQELHGNRSAAFQNGRHP